MAVYGLVIPYGSKLLQQWHKKDNPDSEADILQK